MSAEEDVLRKHNLYACIQCGTCTGSCPVAFKSGLNVRRVLTRVLREHKLSMDVGDDIWACTTCSTCKIRCPRELSPVDVVIDTRALMVERGSIQPTLRDALESVYKHGNPWGKVRGKRTTWTEGLPMKHISELNSGLLYFVGCTAAYDPRVQEVARALVKLFNAVGVEFGTLGTEENCCGSEVHGVGETGLFEVLVEENTALFEKYGVEHVVTGCPHGFNVFKNRYSLKCTVQHYTQYLAELLNAGKLKFSKDFEKTVTYHDPCFLGKQNNVYDPPRAVVENIPGVKLLELDRSRSRSLCCEGGGGRMWVDIPGERLGETRINDAVDLGAEILLTSCPFCLINLEDAAKTAGKEDKIKVMDIAELAAQAI